MNQKIDLIITRHAGLLDYLQEAGLVEEGTPVFSHASESDVRGKNVLGVLPHHLSCLTNTYTEVALDLLPTMRGRELTADEIRECFKGVHTYRVDKIS